MISQHFPGLGAVRQQAIIWANVDPNFCRHNASLDHNRLRMKNTFEDRATGHRWIPLKTKR